MLYDKILNKIKVYTQNKSIFWDTASKMTDSVNETLKLEHKKGICHLNTKIYKKKINCKISLLFAVGAFKAAFKDITEVCQEFMIITCSQT